MPDVREPVMPAPLRAVQILLPTLALAGIVSMLALSEGLTAYGQGELMAPWLLVWVNAAVRFLLGVPVIVLLFLPESTAWFDRER